MKLKATIISIVSVLIIGLTAILLYCFWPAIKGTVDNSKYYTQEELQESYDKGYNDGCKTETELTGQVKYYKSLVDEYYIQVNTLNDEITMLTKTKKDYETQIANIESQNANLQIQVNNLTTIKTNNETTIASLNNQITSLQNQVTNLTNSVEDKSEQITTLNSQITTLQNTVSQLQTTNDLNVATITSLNTQIANLNTQISDMTLQSQNSQSQINALNNKINELQKSVTYYESYIAQLENGEQVVATFEFDGSVYNIQIVNKGSKLSVTTPTSTTYKIFNGWTVNGSAIDLSIYTITTNTKIVADITYKYDVKFKVDDNVVNSQIIIKNNCATLPTNPTKDGYEFDGWSLNGVDIISDIPTKQVTQNVTYIAVFTKLHTVTFVNGEENSTIKVRNGAIVTEVPSTTSTLTKIFNGWKVGNNFVDFNTYKIYSDTTFIADYTVKTFATMSWDEISNLSTSGEASTYFNVGDEKTITATIEGVNQELTFVILGFNHDDLADGTGKAGISIGLKGVTAKKDYSCFSGDYGYKNSDFYKTILPDILSNLPTELKQNIKTVTKGCIYNSQTTYTVDCQLFLFSAKEILGDVSFANVSTQYEYYKSHTLYNPEPNNNIISRDYFGGYTVELTNNSANYPEGYTTDDYATLLCFGFCI